MIYERRSGLSHEYFMSDTTVKSTENLTYKGEETDEMNAICLIRDGADIKDFNFPSTLMLFAAVNYQKDGWKFVPSDERWGKRLAKLAVSKDYRAMKQIPEILQTACITEFAESESKQSRKTIGEWVSVFKGLKPDLIKKILKVRPSLKKYLDKDTLMEKQLNVDNIKQKAPKEPIRITIKKEEDEFKVIGVDKALGGEIDTGISGEEFLALPVKEKTEELLDKIVNSSRELPENFIKSLIIPNRNAYFFKEKGDMKRYEIEKAQILPYIGQNKCKEIAKKHPEASLETPQFLDKAAVKLFWDNICQQTPDKMKYYYMKLPAEMIDKEMAEKMKLDSDIINHTPEIFKDEELVSKYLEKYPFEVMYMPEQYQLLKYLIKDGVNLNIRSIRYIKNKDLRKKIQIALKIR